MAAQQPDIIVLDGETRHLYTNPLEDYWSKLRKKRPEFRAHPYCKRGYIASWEVQDNQLYLINIDAHFLQRSFLSGKKVLRYTMQTLFGDHSEEGVLAFWFTGKLRIPNGRMTRYVHNGYESRFEKEIIISIHQGSVTKKVLLDYSTQHLVPL